MNQRTKRILRRPTAGRALVLGWGLALLGLAATGCGAKAPSVANLSPTTQTSGTTAKSGSTSTKATRPSPAALAACFTAHGFPPSAGSGSGGNAIQLPGIRLSNVNPDSPQFQAAMQACRKFLPGGGPPQLTPAQEAEAAKALASFAACMRKNGVSNFPDPNGKGRFPPGSLNNLDPSTPSFQTANKICRPLMSKLASRIQFG